MKFYVKKPFIISLVALAPAIASAEKLECKTVKHFKDGASSGVDAELTVERGRVLNLILSTYNASGKEGGGYSCYLNTAESDPKPQWTYSPNKAVVKLKDEITGDDSVVEVTQNSEKFTIKLTDVSSSYCGFGAEWPAGIEIKKGTRTCRVTK